VSPPASFPAITSTPPSVRPAAKLEEVRPATGPLTEAERLARTEAAMKSAPARNRELLERLAKR
jgi:hypothetical protein